MTPCSALKDADREREIREGGWNVPNGIARTSVHLCGLSLAVGLPVELHMLLELHMLHILLEHHILVTRMRLGLRILAPHMPFEPGKLQPDGQVEPRMQLESCRPYWLDWGLLPLVTVF